MCKFDIVITGLEICTKECTKECPYYTQNCDGKELKHDTFEILKEMRKGINKILGVGM